MFSGSAPMQPVTMTLPFSLQRLRRWRPAIPPVALSRKPQVLTMTTSEPTMLARQLIAFGAQARDDPLAVDQRFGAAERNKGNARRGGHRRSRKGAESGALGQVARGVNR